MSFLFSAPNSCGTLDCSDPFSIFIQAILNLRLSGGATPAEVIIEAGRICPNISFTEGDAYIILESGIKRCIFSRGSSTTYLIDAGMVNRDARNAKYWRGPGCTDSFYNC